VSIVVETKQNGRLLEEQLPLDDAGEERNQRQESGLRSDPF
jgi:hypothetical protein